MSTSYGKLRIVGYFFLAIIIYFIFFLRLSSFHIRTWDESIYAVEAYEMLQDGNYLVPHNNGQIDYMHAKPLLAVWLQAISIKLFGFNELAVRLPSAIAGALCALIVFFLLKRNSNSMTAWCAFLVLVTSRGFVYFHTSRTGDTDAILTLFLLLSNINFFSYLSEEKNKNLVLYFLFLALAFLTKSFAALLFIPGHIILLTLQNKFMGLFRKKAFYLGALIFSMLSLGYIYLRHKADPLFITTLVSTDLARTGNAIDNHKEPVYFYIDNFLSGRFSIWLFPLTAAIAYCLLNRHTIEPIMSWALTLTLTFFMLISFSATKLEWYDMPLYPYMAIAAGYIVYILLDKTAGTGMRRVFFALVIFSMPLYTSVKQSYSNSMNSWEYGQERIAEYLFNKINLGGVNNLAVADTSFNGPFLFYKYELKEKSQNLKILKPEEIKIRDKVIVVDDKIKSYVRHKFNASVIDSLYEVTVFEIKGSVADSIR